MKKPLFCFLSLIPLGGLLTACAPQEASVGIIGGADGPTSIFIASSAGGQKSLLIIALIIVFLAVVLYRIRKTRPEKPEKDQGRKPPGTL